MNFHFKTLGCKVNQYETEALREALIRLGHTANSLMPPDVIIVNSCTVTAESDRKVRQILRKLRNDHKDAVILLTGCMVQAFPEKSTSLNEADIVIGNRDAMAVINAVLNYKGERFLKIEQHNPGDTYTGLSISAFSERTRAFMKIEDGCNRYCSYCIIPKARGFVRSRSLEDISAEANKLADNGYKEVVLVGINLSAYGLGTELNICDAVETVAKISGIKRIRLGSLEPDHITDSMLARLAACDKFCPQFHLSLQSGCNETLKRMNRHYDTEFYLDLIARIRAAFADAAITTDIMVGFAGETDYEFNESVNFVKKAGFARSHIFTYSRRAGTAADKLQNHLTKAVKEQRAAIMASVTANSEKAFLETQIGRVFPVLFEAGKSGVAEGYTPNYTKVIVTTHKIITGQILPVKIQKANSTYCEGKIMEAD